MSLRATHAIVDLNAIRNNVTNLRKKSDGRKVLLAVKADGYGHGAVQISRLAEEEGLAEYLGVAEICEAVELREAGITLPILKFGAVFENETEDIFEYEITPTLFDRVTADRLNIRAGEMNRILHVHIKVDSGMGRIGVPIKDAMPVIEHIHKCKNLKIEGIYTHFPASDESDRSFAENQIKKFCSLLDELKKKNIEIPLKHMSNSGAIFFLPGAYMDMIRPGISLYGFYPSSEADRSIKLIPAMTLRSRISYIKKVPAGTPVSYGMTYKTSEETYIATLPLGYADGYNRLLTNRGIVKIGRKTYPVAGRVCMDQICVDLGPDTDAQVGDTVILFGNYRETPFTVNEIAQICGTITYEITCNINKRVQRLYVDTKKKRK